MPAITAEGLTKVYGSRAGKVRALDGLDLSVEEGTVLGLLGPNGAGKTTTVRVLATLLRPDSGRATVLGYDVLRDAQRLRREIGLSGQYAAVDENLTGAENLWMFGRLYQLPSRTARTRAGELLEEFGLSGAAGRVVKTYSGGMRRRLDLASALIGRPRLLFLDEPTTGLDPRSRIGMWEVIRGLVRTGSTLLLTTQYLEEADALADDIAVVDSGRIIARGTADELKSQVGGDVVTVTVERQDQVGEVARLVGELRGAERPQVVDHRVVGRVPHGGAALVELVRGLDRADITVSGIESRRPSLDDVFLGLTGRSLRDSDAPAPEEVAV